MTIKRFTDAQKWDDSWFRKLTPMAKLLWGFICDRCDHAGIWKVDRDSAEFFIGAPIDWEGATIELASRIVALGKGDRWFIPKFVIFQYGPAYNHRNRPHVSAMRILELHGLLWGSCPSSTEAPSIEHASPMHGAKDKDTDKDKEDVFSERESPERGEATAPLPVPADLSPKLRDTYQEIAASEGSGPAGYEAATRALRASQILFGTPTPSQMNATYQAAREAGCVAKDPAVWPDFRKKMKAERLQDQSKTTATHSDEDRAHYARLDERTRR